MSQVVVGFNTPGSVLTLFSSHSVWSQFSHPIGQKQDLGCSGYSTFWHQATCSAYMFQHHYPWRRFAFHPNLSSINLAFHGFIIRVILCYTPQRKNTRGYIIWGLFNLGWTYVHFFFLSAYNIWSAIVQYSPWVHFWKDIFQILN